FVIGRRVDVNFDGVVGCFGEEVDFPQLPVRHVLHRIEVLIVGGNFNTAAPTAGAIEHDCAGVGNGDSIDVELVIVKAFVLRVGEAGPHAILALGHRILDASDV